MAPQTLNPVLFLLLQSCPSGLPKKHFKITTSVPHTNSRNNPDYKPLSAFIKVNHPIDKTTKRQTNKQKPEGNQLGELKSKAFESGQTAEKAWLCHLVTV